MAAPPPPPAASADNALLENMLRGYSRLRNDVRQHTTKLSSAPAPAPATAPAPAPASGSAGTGAPAPSTRGPRHRYGVRPASGAPKTAPRIKIPTSLQQLAGPPSPTLSTSRLPMSTRTAAAPAEATSAWATSSTVAARRRQRAQSAPNKPRRPASSGRPSTAAFRNYQQSGSQSSIPSRPATASARALSQTPTMVNSILPLGSAADAPASAANGASSSDERGWRHVTEGFAPGPNYRPASSSQAKRSYGPLDLASAPELADEPAADEPDFIDDSGDELEAPPLEASPAGSPSRPATAGETATAGYLTPSERIASNFTPSLGGLSPRRLHQGAAVPPPAQGPSRSPSPPAQPSKSRSRGFLPLEIFDNLDYETHTPEEWVALGGSSRTRASSLYFSTDGTSEWLPCEVVSFDAAQNAYLIEWEHSRKRKLVKRLNLLFDDENKAHFLERVAEARKLQVESEARLRYHLCVDEQANRDVTPMDTEQLDHILRLVADEFPVAHLGVVESGLAEVQDEYYRSMKKAIFDYNYLNEAQQERLADVQLAPPEKDTQVPEFALVPVPKHPFASRRRFIQDNLFLCRDSIITALHAVFTECVSVRSLSLVNLAIPISPLHVQDFVHMQMTKRDMVIPQLTGDWSPAIATSVRTYLAYVFDFSVESHGAYEGSPTSRFLRLISLIMSDALRVVVENSIEEYVAFFECFAVEDGADSSSALPALPAAGAAAANTSSSSDEAADTETLASLYPATYLRAGLQSPLFRVSLELKERSVIFVPSLENLERQVLGAYDAIFQDVVQIPRIDNNVLNLVQIATEHLTVMHQDDARRARIQRALAGNLGAADQLLSLYHDYDYLIRSDAKQQAIQFYNANESLGACHDEIRRHRSAADEIMSRTYDEVHFGLISVNCRELKRQLHAMSNQVAAQLLACISDDIVAKNKALTKKFVEVEEKIQTVPDNAEDWNALRSFCDSLDFALVELNREIEQVQQGWSILEEFEHPFSEAEFVLFWDVRAWPKRLEQDIQLRNEKLEQERTSFVAELRQSVADVRSEIAAISAEVGQFASYGDVDEVETYAAQVEQLQERIRAAQANIRLYNAREKLFGFTLNAFPELEHVSKRFDPFAQLWWIALDFTKEYPLWLDGPLVQTDSEKVEEQNTNWRKSMQRIMRALKDFPVPFAVANDIKSKLDDFREHMALFKCLRNAGLRDRHWTLISQVGFPELSSREVIQSLTFARILDMGLEEHLPRIQEISDLAATEYVLEKSLDNMANEWKQIEFDIVSYRDSGTFIIRATDDIIQLLDDQIIRTQSMRGSAYIKPFEKRVKAWEEKLSRVQEILDEWLACQRTWLYLEPIFGSPDILSQMPTEGRRFQTVNTMWKKIMDATVKNPNVLAITGRYHLFDSFVQANKLLEEIQKGLNEYLETKRLAFPRFYFLSNEELLEILSKTRDASAIQPHLRKCFENIDRLELVSGDDARRALAAANEIAAAAAAGPTPVANLSSTGQIPVLDRHSPSSSRAATPTQHVAPSSPALSATAGVPAASATATATSLPPVTPGSAPGSTAAATPEPADSDLVVVSNEATAELPLATAMYSAETEQILLVRPVQTTPKAEEWLLDTERAMQDSIRFATGQSLAAHSMTSREKWVLEWPGQVVLAVNQIFWTQRVHRGLSTGIKGLRFQEAKFTDQLQRLVELVRGDLTNLNRLTLEALIVLDVHGRDVVTRLVQDGISSEDDFDWISQLRYYWEDEDVRLRMVNATLQYGYEYLGNTQRLVITPLTDRCYITLVGALHLHYGGAPEGPAGTGKTETCKDLAKAVAKQCVVFNCSDGLDYLAMGKFFKGLASSGAWCCFDEFNRIDIEVLSVIAQQILTIQRSINAGLEKFNFEGRTIKLDATCAIFITMNPGYAGRSELPDNLKALFRPVAMMVPDYALIAEISLFSFGFSDARNLARKIVATFRLSSEQLSAQHHYDFGMRAVKAVLRAAGVLKRTASKGTSEDQLVLRALIDVNEPKFLSHDLPLFEGIISDLFPGVDKPDGEHEELTRAVDVMAKRMGLQPVPALVGKCLQLFDTLAVRHGVMLVGDAFSGKSACLSTLAKAVTLVYEAKTSTGRGLKKHGSKFLSSHSLVGIEGQSALEDESLEVHELGADLVAHPDGGSPDAAAAAAAAGRFYPVKKYTLNPKSVTMGQLYGQFDEVSHEWTDGIMANIVRQCASDASVAHKWIVFDGPVDSLWIESMNTALDDTKKLCLSSGEIIALTSSMSMIFEVGDLAAASPATVSRCGMVYMEPSQLGWRPIVESWLVRVSTARRTIHDRLWQLFDWLVQPSLDFARESCPEVVPSLDIGLVRSLCNIVGSLMSEFRSHEHERVDPDELMVRVECYFVFGLIWSIGAAGDLDGRQRFSAFLRTLCNRAPDGVAPLSLPIPIEGSVYDYCFLREESAWRHWMSGPDASYTVPTDVDYTDIIVPTIDSVRHAYLIELLVSNNHPTLLVGPTGIGKTLTIKKQIGSMASDTFRPVFFTFSARSSANQTQELIESKLEKRRKTVHGPPHGCKMLVVVDDLNMPAKDQYGSQPAIELLRQWMDYGGWYDRKTNAFRHVVDIQFLAAMGPPGGGRNHVSRRYTRHFNLVSMPVTDDASLERIFGTIMAWFVEPFPEAIRVLKDKLVASTIHVYQTLSTELLPTPAKSHYLYNLRDLSKVMQGVAMVRDNRKITEPSEILRLWCHECERVFQDRLVDDHDRSWFHQLLAKTLEETFDTTYEEATGVDGEADEGQVLLYGDFLTPDPDSRVYAQLPEMTTLAQTVQDYLDDFNSFSRVPMPLVLFPYAVQHLTRIARILRQPYGHALLIGLNGSGRTSLTRLAAHIGDHEVFEVEMSRSYGMNEWRDDMKDLMHKAGVEGKSMVFLLNDRQLVNDAFLEDVNNLLNTGEIPNLFASDEIVTLIDQLKTVAIQHDRAESRGEIFEFFLQRCRQNIHVVLCMSPVGDALRARLRMFPSLVNCCTIDWFAEWPRSALRAVAEYYISDMILDGALKPGIVDICVQMHSDVSDLTRRYLAELRRRFYISPTSYLELISSFKGLLSSKRKELVDSKRKYETGLDKLLSTATAVTEMQAELYQLKPLLLEMSTKTEELMATIDKDREEATKAKVVVDEEQALASRQAEAAKKMKTECEADLAEVMPTMLAAEKALQTLNRQDIYEVKSMKNPPEGVKIVLEAVCIMKEVKPDVIDSERPGGRKKLDYWKPSIKMLSDGNFLKSLFAYDRDNIPQTVIDKVKPYIRNKSFEPTAMQKVSIAATSLCQWVRAMYRYHKVYKVVAPKRAALAEAEEKLAETVEAVRVKLQQVRELEEHTNELIRKYEEAVDKKEELSLQVTNVEKKLDRAQRLLGGLGGEKERWTVARDSLGKSYDNLVGDVLLSAGVINYLGAFTVGYRQECQGEWMRLLRERNIPSSREFSLVSVFGDRVRIREWHISGLPTDKFSVENAIIVSRSHRWPLMVDPQVQANKWIRAMEAINSLDVVKPTDSDLMRRVENAVQFGNPILLENVGEEIDPSLYPVLLRQTFKQGGNTMVRLGGSVIEFSPNFRMYLTTKLHNPHFKPDICTRLTLLNFTTSPEGVEDQLLGIVVAKERGDLEEDKSRLVVQSAQYAKELSAIENQILEMLSKAEGNFLEDDVLIETLSASKQTSQEVTERQAAAVETEAKIDEARAVYQPVAARASLLYFCVSDLAAVESMYQYSLAWFTGLFVRSIAQSEPSFDLGGRLKALIEHFTYALYQNVCRSLFEKDKLLFAFLLCSRIMGSEDRMDPVEWKFLLTGAAPMPVVPSLADSDADAEAQVQQPEQTEEQEGPRAETTQSGNAESKGDGAPADGSGNDDEDAGGEDKEAARIKKERQAIEALLADLAEADQQARPEWLPERAWSELVQLSRIPAMQGLWRSFASGSASTEAWREYYQLEDGSADGGAMPADAVAKLSPFQRILVLRCLKPDKAIPAVQSFIAGELGPKFVDPPTFDLMASYSDSHPNTPIIFLLSPGVDPMEQFTKLADRLGFAQRWATVSLGQGQGPIAERAIYDAAEKGRWVLLQNCHLARSWMPELERITENLFAQGGVHTDFRLWLTSTPTPYFPVSILQNGIKLTNEAPKGMKANLRRLYTSFDAEWFGDCPSNEIGRFHKLLFGLSFFHSVLQERRTFGPIGWNVSYEFTEADLVISSRQLRMFLSAGIPQPYKALLYLTGQANYGGRVTDYWDRRTLMCLLRDFYTDRIMDDGYRFSESPEYFAPGDGTLDHYLKFIDSLPINTRPEVYGLHANADIVRAQAETDTMLTSLLLLQPRFLSGGGQTEDQILEGVASEILQRLPGDVDAREAELRHPIRRDDCMATVLHQEVHRVNRLLSVVRTTLTELVNAIRGFVVMSADLEAISRSMLMSRVPEMWKKVAYESERPLGAWVTDLIQRAEFFRKWVFEGKPHVYWLPGVFYPQAFLTGQLQNFARARGVAIDTVEFGFEVLPGSADPAAIGAPPETGCFVHGLFLEGARWDSDKGCLVEARHKELKSALPVLWMRAQEKKTEEEEKEAGDAGDAVFHCPLYKTSRRRGVLSTTGHSTNFVVDVQLPAGDGGANKWVKRGVALVCEGP